MLKKDRKKSEKGSYKLLEYLSPLRNVITEFQAPKQAYCQRFGLPTEDKKSRKTDSSVTLNLRMNIKIF